MAEQERFAITRHDQLGRNGSVEGPDRVRVLCREARMELQWNWQRWINAGVQVRSHSRVVDRVGLSLGLRHLNRDLRRVITETLVRPDWSRWTAFDRTSE